MSHADSNGLSSDPNAEYAASVSRGDGYVARAEVLVKATTENVAVFAYPSDGRASLNNLAGLLVDIDKGEEALPMYEQASRNRAGAPSGSIRPRRAP